MAGLGRLDRRAEAASDGELYFQADLTDRAAVLQAVSACRPDVVFHLAASPAIKDAGSEALDRLLADSVTATTSLLSSVAATCRPLVVLAGSSAQYGTLPVEENPITEESRFNPTTPYGWAKIAAEAIAMAFAISGRADVIPVRMFNLIGPLEPATTVASAFASRINAVLEHRADAVVVRDLTVVRDFSDVRDVAAGYVDIAERGKPGRAYNLCSGRAVTVGAVLDGLLSAAGLERDIIRVLPETESASVPYQVGSVRRTAAEIGWSATTDLADSLHALLSYVQQNETR